MKKVILLTPLSGNGGIVSWSRKFLKTFNLNRYEFIAIDRSIKGRQFDDNRLWSRFYAGIKEMVQIQAKVKDEIRKQKIDLLHATTSGSLGTVRDYIISNICKQYKIPSIMHCHYGCISEDVNRGVYGWFLRKTMRQFSQIWVLDNRSLCTLRRIKGLENKVFLIPNSIEVKSEESIVPKSYKHVAFIANLIPSKGLFELIEAVLKLNRNDLKLSIVGVGSTEVVNRVQELAGERLGKTIYLLGQLPNEKVMSFLDTVDIVALPTYYPWEAFPISILEAMSKGKIVISTKRAAIGDILTDIDGKPCGCFVREKDIDDIVNAINWCIENPTLADNMCKKAYEKVYQCYRMEVVYDVYQKHYDELMYENS